MTTIVTMWHKYSDISLLNARDDYRVFRVGTGGRTRYRPEDKARILQIIKEYVPEAGIAKEGIPEVIRKARGIKEMTADSFGSNYIFVSAPKDAIEELRQAAAAIDSDESVAIYTDVDSMEMAIK